MLLHKHFHSYKFWNVILICEPNVGDSVTQVPCILLTKQLMWMGKNTSDNDSLISWMQWEKTP